MMRAMLYEQPKACWCVRQDGPIVHRIWVDGTEFRWPGNKPWQQHENRAGSNTIGGNSSSTERWK